MPASASTAFTIPSVPNTWRHITATATLPATTEGA